MMIFNIPVTSIIIFALFGLVVGILVASLDVGKVRGGAFLTVLLGITGSILGGILANLIFGVTVLRFNLTILSVIFIGALIFSILHRILFRKTGHIKTRVTKLS